MSTAVAEQPHNESDTELLQSHSGVKTVQATHKVYGRYSKWMLFLGLALAAYVYSLDGQTTYLYLAGAVSEFQSLSFLSSIQVAQSIIVAVFKPVVAKLADVTSRGTSFCGVLLFYVIGYIVIASAGSAKTIAGGIVLYAVGYTGLQLLTQIIIADITTLKWRGLVSSLISLPFIINAFVGSNVASQVLEHVGWRWGYGMFAILIPVSLSPLIATLVWAEFRAKRIGLVAKKPRASKPATLALEVAHEMDIVGLLLLAASVSLILLPLTLANNAKSHWKNPSMIAMIVVGFVIFPLFLIWEFKFAKFPAIPKRFFRNRTIALASFIGMFDFISFYLTFTYLFSFVFVVKPWTQLNLNYFIQTQSVALTVFGIAAGVVLRFTGRYRYLLAGGLAIRLLGVGLMIHSRGANAPDAEVVWTQILQGIGGGIAATASQVAAQASVPHIDVAMATAVVLLLTEIGGAIGGALSGAIWTNSMPNKLAQYLPDLPEANRTALYQSITSAASYPRGDPIREGVIHAYGDVMKTMVIVATAVSAVPLILSLFMPDWYLGDQQNAVENRDLSGDIDGESDVSSRGSEHGEDHEDVQKAQV